MKRRISAWAPTVSVIGFAIANVAYQLMQGTHDFSVAFERTWFQGVALLAAWLTWQWA